MTRWRPRVSMRLRLINHHVALRWSQKAGGAATPKHCEERAAEGLRRASEAHLARRLVDAGTGLIGTSHDKEGDEHATPPRGCLCSFAIPANMFVKVRLFAKMFALAKANRGA